MALRYIPMYPFHNLLSPYISTTACCPAACPVRTCSAGSVLRLKCNVHVTSMVDADLCGRAVWNRAAARHLIPPLHPPLRYSSSLGPQLPVHHREGINPLPPDSTLHPLRHMRPQISSLNNNCFREILARSVTAFHLSLTVKTQSVRFPKGALRSQSGGYRRGRDWNGAASP
jgi:hypothetical protein